MAVQEYKELLSSSCKLAATTCLKVVELSNAAIRNGVEIKEFELSDEAWKAIHEDHTDDK